MNTVKVKGGETGYYVINEADFDAETMKKATAAQVKAADKKAEAAKKAD